MKNKYLYIIALMAITLLQLTMHGQGISIGSGTTFTMGNSTITLPGNWNNAGTFIAGTGTVIMNGSSGSQTITNNAGETFNNLTINKISDDVQLVDSITINGILTLASGDFNINDKHIFFGSSSSLNESAGNTIKGGTASCTKTLNAPSSQNVIGLELTSASDLGNTAIIRGHAAQSGHGNSSILRYFDIMPSNNAGLNATLVFYYDESELNGLTESELQLFRSSDGGVTWENGSGNVDAANNTVTLNGIDGFSRWTLGANSQTLHNIPPPDPQNLIAADSSSQTITIKWQKNSAPDFFRYAIYQGTSPNPTTLADYSTGGVNDTTKTFTGLTNGIRYYFRVTALDFVGNESGYSNEVNAVPADRIAPTVPQGLTVTDSSNQSISIVWQIINEPDFKEWRIYSGTDLNNLTFLVSITGIMNTSKSFTGLVNGTRYYFYVTAVDNSNNESEFSNRVSAIPGDYKVPSVPRNLIISDSSNQTITLRWTQNSDPDFLLYRIYRGTTPGPISKTDSVINIADTVKIITGLINGTRYYFRITAVDNTGNESGYSNEVNAAPVDQIAPSTPVNLAAIDSSNQTILIKWRKNTEADFSKYRIYCGISPNPDVKIDSVMAGISDTLKVIGGLTNGIRYYVRITAADIYGNESGYSNEVSAVPYAVITFTDGSDHIAPDIISNTGNNPVGRFKLTAETDGAALASVKITFSGAFTGVHRVKLWSSPDTVFNNDLMLDSVSFFKNSPVILNGDTSAISLDGTYYFVTVDVGPSSGNITTAIKTNADINIAAGFIMENILDAPLAGNLSVITDVENIELSAVKEFSLSQNYPNPFNPTTNIKYQLPKHSYVVLKVYNLLGQEVKTLVDQYQQQGAYEVKFNAQSLTSGIYIYSLKAGNFSQTKKLILLK
ncbi:MAG: fibronectin type III domain-containing protein [Bacteroidetes bacterium]|nr:fibronectin type III domain-containing protein [Bacteroidota bacterium]